MHRLLAATCLLAAFLSFAALAQHHGRTLAPAGAHSGHVSTHRAPALPGQDAFGAVQEILAILEADPDTDWEKVDLGLLHRHLIDMNEVVLNAEVVEKRSPQGLSIEVSGAGRTRGAIKRMLLAHAQEIDAHRGWRVSAKETAEGVRLDVVASEPKEVARLHALGFIGLLATGGHHQPHHLAMARGEFASHRR